MIADNPDAPVNTWTHWFIDGTRQGRIDFRRIGYGGPCPPPEKPHRYFFKVYAWNIPAQSTGLPKGAPKVETLDLDAGLDLRVGANRDELERAMKGHVLAQGELMSKYGR